MHLWRQVFKNCNFVIYYYYLGGDRATWTVVMHEDPENLGDDLWEIDLELCAQCPYDLLNQQDDGALHGTVECPVVLKYGRL